MSTLIDFYMFVILYVHTVFTFNVSKNDMRAACEYENTYKSRSFSQLFVGVYFYLSMFTYVYRGAV